MYVFGDTLGISKVNLTYTLRIYYWVIRARAIARTSSAIVRRHVYITTTDTLYI